MRIIDPLRALIAQASQEASDMRSLSAFLNASLLLIAGRTSLNEAAYHLVNKVHANPDECVSHEKAVTELHLLADKTAYLLHQLADCYAQHAKKRGVL